MTKATLVGLASLAIVASAVLAPAVALADGRHHGRGDSHRLHTTLPHRLPPPRHFHGHRSRFGVIAPPAVIYSAPVYASPVYVPTPVYVPAPPVYAPAPVVVPSPSAAPAPMETVIEFPNGRYELRGDGITTPYRWVWIPNPPPAPPSEEPAAPAPAPAPARAPRTEFYRWTDADGVVHLSDRWEKIPEAYRAKASKSQS